VEQDWSESLECFRLMVENTSDLASLHEPDGTYVYISPSYERLLGYKKDELIGTNPGHLVHPDDLECVVAELEKLALKEISSSKLTYQIRQKSGDYIWLETYTQLIFNHEGEISYLASTSRDITNRKNVEAALRKLNQELESRLLEQTTLLTASREQLKQEKARHQLLEEQLHKSQAFYQGIVEDQMRLICRFLPDGTITFVNEAYCRYFNLQQDQLVGCKSSSLMPLNDAPLLTDIVAGLSPENPALMAEYSVTLPTGEVRWHQWTSRAFYNEQNKFIKLQAVGQDITEHKRTQERLRLLESAVTNANDVILITEGKQINPPGPKIVYVNTAFTATTGYLASEVIGLTPRILQGPKTDRSQLDKIRTALSRQEPVQVELINYRKDRSEFWTELNIVPIADEGGFITHFVSVQRDISDRKQNEAEVLKALAQERELNELKSSFISMTSHEFRTPLATIRSAAELLERFPVPKEEKPELFGQIQTAVTHMVRLLEDMLFISCSEAGKLQFKPAPLDLVKLSRTLVTEVQIGEGKHHKFVCEFQGDGSSVMDEKLLRSLLGNLLSNAIKYSHPGSTVELRLTCDGNTAIFKVQDRGIGIPKPDRQRLFECFHRASNVGAVCGTGLGLTIAKNCVDLHGGAIAVESEVGRGTTFTVTLPMNPKQSKHENNIGD